jgi:hypothetical protein
MKLTDRTQASGAVLNNEQATGSPGYAQLQQQEAWGTCLSFQQDDYR